MLWEITQGSVRVLAIEDGGHTADPTVLFPTADPSYFDGPVRISFSCFLIEKGSDLALVDVGFGRDVPTRPGVEAGQLVEALHVLNIDPSAIGTIIHTHVHPDHVGGHLRDGEVLFTNADVFIHEDELIREPWTHYPVPEVIQRSLFALKERQQIHRVETLSTLPMGLGLIETPGHTPGHLSVEVTTDDGPVLIAGDVTHHPAQLEHPEWHGAADMDIPEANRSRRALFGRAAQLDAILAPSHYRRPGFGKVIADRGEWRFVPLR